MIYLASTSPRRKKLLKEAGVKFSVLAPNYEEKNHSRGSVTRLIREHALGKALSVVPKIKNGVIIGSDTVVYFRRHVIGKPRDLTDAATILGRLQGQKHVVYTAVAILKVKNGVVFRKKVFVERTQVFLKKMNAIEIKKYFTKINPLDKAGAYAAQNTSHSIIEKIKGSYSNVVGLPVERVKKAVVFG